MPDGNNETAIVRKQPRIQRDVFPRTESKRFSCRTVEKGLVVTFFIDCHAELSLCLEESIVWLAELPLPFCVTLNGDRPSEIFCSDERVVSVVHFDILDSVEIGCASYLLSSRDFEGLEETVGLPSVAEERFAIVTDLACAIVTSPVCLGGAIALTDGGYIEQVVDVSGTDTQRRLLADFRGLSPSNFIYRFGNPNFMVEFFSRFAFVD